MLVYHRNIHFFSKVLLLLLHTHVGTVVGTDH